MAESEAEYLQNRNTNETHQSEKQSTQQSQQIDIAQKLKTYLVRKLVDED